MAVAVSTDGVVYVADRYLPGIWEIRDGKATVYFRASKKYRTPLNAVRCLAVDPKGRLLAGDSATRDVYRFDKPGEPKPLTGGRIGIPMAITTDAQGTVFAADLELHRIVKVPEAGGPPELFAEVPAPRGLFLDAQGRCWVVSHGEDQLLRLAADGSAEVVVKGRPFRFPHQVVVDEQGTAYVSDGYADTIWRVPPDGKPEAWIAGDPLKNPVGLAWHAKTKTLYIADPHRKTIYTAAPDGKLKPLEVAFPDN